MMNVDSVIRKSIRKLIKQDSKRAVLSMLACHLERNIKLTETTYKEYLTACDEADSLLSAYKVHRDSIVDNRNSIGEVLNNLLIRLYSDENLVKILKEELERYS